VGIFVWIYGLDTGDLVIQIMGGAIMFVPIALHIVPLPWREPAGPEGQDAGTAPRKLDPGKPAKKFPSHYQK